MPTLDWLGKAAVIKYRRDVPYRLLEPVPELSARNPEHGHEHHDPIADRRG